MGSNNKNKKNNGRAKWQDRYLKEMETLRREIAEKEKEGVNVTRAWRLFGVARKLSREEDIEKAFDYIEKVRGDLTWKERLYGYSTRTLTHYVAYGVPILIAAPLIAYIIAKCGYGYDLFAEKPVMLGMPTFILAWGYIGSIAYVLISVSNKISKRLFDIRDPIGYFYRVVLGGILAGVIFYILQLGLVSLPGTAGEEVNAALKRAGAPAKYRKYVAERERLEEANYKNEDVISEFELRYIDPYDINDVKRKAKLLLRYVEEWREFDDLECDVLKEDPNFKGKIDVGKIRKAMGKDEEEDYNKYILASFEIIKDRIISDKHTQIDINNNRLDKIDEYISNIKYIIESAILEETLGNVNSELRQLTNGLRENKEQLKEKEGQLVMVESGDIKPEDKRYRNAADLEADIERINKTIRSLEKKIEELETEKVRLNIQIQEERKRENEKPVWESAIFVVVAFFSGYSINFVTKMFDRAMSAIISGKPGEAETEGEQPPEPVAGGEEAVG